MRAVNLLPKDAQGGGKSLRQEDPAVVIGSVLGVVVMIALVASFLTAHGKANAQQKELTAARLQLAQLSEKRKAEAAKLKPVTRSEPVTPIVPPPSISGQEASWLSSVSTQLEQRIAWDRILREVSLVMPSDVTLSSLDLSTPTVAVGAAPAAQGFTISGTAYSYESVARLLSRLALVPDLSNVTLGSMFSGTPAQSAGGTAAAPTTSGTVQFNITAAIKGAAAPAAATPAPVAPASTDTTSTEGSGA